MGFHQKIGLFRGMGDIPVILDIDLHMKPDATNALLGLYGTVYHLASLMDRTTEVGIGLFNAVGSPT